MSNVTPNSEFQSASLSPRSMEGGVEPPHSRELANELRARWQRGERINVETLGDLFDAIRDDEEQLLDLLYHEVLIREEFGDEPDVEQFVARFPKIEARLRRQFEVHEAVDQDWRGDGFELDEELLNSERQQPTIGADGRTSRLIRMTEDLSAPPGYELLEELGRGGMAIVFKARQQSLNRLVALKMILAGQFASEQALARFRQEAQAVAQLQHAGIVQIHEVGEHHGLPFLSLEYVPGGTLQQLLNGRPLPDDVAARLVESLARTMHFAHERGVIHRDLKPANVLMSCNPKRQRGSEPCNPKRQRGRAFPPDPLAQLASEEPNCPGERPVVSPPIPEWNERHTSRSADALPLAGTSSSGTSSLADASGYMAQQTLPLDESQLSTPNSPLPTPKISDFGLARLLDGGSELTTTGQVIGTPSYMAPEQAGQAKDSAGPAPDIYSLGAILYETLTGRPPFQAATILQTLEQVRDQEPVPPRQLQSRLPVDLETICLKCLDKSPARRYVSALALADDLARFLNHESITARPSGVIERSRKWIHRRPTVAALLALITALTVFGWTAILREAGRTKIEALRANQNESTAHRDRDEANKERRVAESERQNAREAQARAEANFLKATEVVTKFSELGNQLQNEARQQQTSSRIFDAALEFYENVLVEHGDDPLVRFQAASAFLRAGEIREILGQQDRSAALIDRAVELLEGLIAEDNSVAEANVTRSVSEGVSEAGSHVTRSVSEGASEGVSEKVSEGTSGVPRLRFGLHESVPRLRFGLHGGMGCGGHSDSVALRRQLAIALQLQASNARHFADLKKADPAYRRCLTVLDSLVRDNPDDVSDAIQRGKVRISFGVMLKATDRIDESLTRHLEAIDILRSVIARWPLDDSSQIELVNALNAYGSALWYVGRIPEAEPLYRESLERSRTLLVRLPNHLRVRIQYARCLLSMTRIDTTTGQFDEAAARMDEGARVMNEVVSNYPDNINYLSELLWLWQDRLSLERRRNNVPQIDRASRMELSLLGNLFRRMSPSTRHGERFALANYRFADWLWRQDQKSDARDHYVVALQVLKQVADRLPNDVTALQHFAWLNAACPIVELRDIPLAETLAMRATELTPQSPLAWQALGAAQLRSANFTAADVSFRKALALSPCSESSAALHALLAVTLNDQNQREAAESELKLATLRTPDSATPQLVRILEECRQHVSQRPISD